VSVCGGGGVGSQKGGRSGSREDLHTHEGQGETPVVLVEVWEGGGEEGGGVRRGGGGKMNGRSEGRREGQGDTCLRHRLEDPHTCSGDVECLGHMHATLQLPTVSPIRTDKMPGVHRWQWEAVDSVNSQ
jgi:hypothetical protein